jgi:hypothetical protein
MGLINLVTLSTSPQVPVIFAWGINNSGQMVEWGSEEYLLTPPPPATGIITVATNLASATFNVTGPMNYTGSGKSFTQPGAPPGTYMITSGAVAEYVTPTALSTFHDK